MRLLMTAWSFFPAQEGGPSNALYWLASGLAKEGYKLRVVTTDRYIPENTVPINQWCKINGFEVIYQSLDKGTDLLYNEIDNCDVLLTDGVCKILYYRLILFALKKHKKVVLSPRGELFDSAINHKGKLYGFFKKLFLGCMRLSFRNRVSFHVTSKEEEDAVVKFFGKRAHIWNIPNYMILPERVEVQQKVEPYILYVGRLNQIKNIDVILSGLAKSKSFRKGMCKFKIAGEKKGEYYESLVAQAKDLGITDSVEFLGLVTGDNKNKLYAGAKCLLLMSKSENFGNVIVEALAQGTPVIASKGTPWQQLDEKGAGWWIEAHPEQVAESVNKVLSMDDDGYAKMRENAYAYSREFDIYTNSGRWVEVIENN